LYRFLCKEPKRETMTDASAKIEKLVQGLGLVGVLGVAAEEIGSGRRVVVNGDEHFAMASTFKVATAVTLLDRVDKGEIQMTDLIDVTPDMLIEGPNPIVTYFRHPGCKLSVANLIEPMITDSDNSAADICLKTAGGPEAVTKMLRSIGITDQRIDRPCGLILKDFYGLNGPATPAVVAAAAAKDPSLIVHMEDRNLEFEKDPRDHSTPKAMLELLLAVDSGKILSTKSREFLLGVMSRTTTGKGRIQGLLPKGTPVADKTGTIGGVANDVGFITLPDGRRIAIAVYTKSSTRPGADRERAIAEVSRSIYDYFYLTSV
jgi:beta-lactamase class A